MPPRPLRLIDLRLAIATMLGLLPLLAADDTATAPDPWQRAIGPWTWMFPRDHGAHPNFKTEWWYFTGNLSDAQNARLRLSADDFPAGHPVHPAQPKSQWAARDFYFGHFTISDLEAQKFHMEERVSRGALGEAHAATDRMDVALGPWGIVQTNPEEQIHLVAGEPTSPSICRNIR